MRNYHCQCIVKFQKIRLYVKIQTAFGQQFDLITNSFTPFSEFNRPSLPDYLLDFGHVILGTVKTEIVKASTVGDIPASFEIERQNFSKTGFLITVEKNKSLTSQDYVEFVVTFDPRGANLSLGPVEHVIPINVRILLIYIELIINYVC
jgi:hypothetical protein